MGRTRARGRHVLLAAGVIAAVSVSGPIDRLGRQPGTRWADDLLGASAALTARL